MHDLYATNHISQMVLPDAFWAGWSQIFLNILGKLRGIQFGQKMNKIRPVMSEIR